MKFEIISWSLLNNRNFPYLKEKLKEWASGKNKLCLKEWHPYQKGNSTLKDTNVLHVCFQIRDIKFCLLTSLLKTSKSQLLQQEQKAYRESFIYKRIGIERNVNSLGLFDAFGAFFFFSRRALLVCFCYMVLTNTVKFHSEKLFCVPEKWGEELSD